MEKYGVEIDRSKVEKEKRAGAGDKVVDSPHRNIPLDPKKGSEPFEKRREDGKEKGR